MKWVENASLRHLNTFGVNARARFLASIDCPQDINTLNRMAGSWPRWVLGGGSNILWISDFPGIVVHNTIQHLEFYQKDGQDLVRAGGGIGWHTLVMETVARGFSGLENLALIPGTCGAAPIQNIGAYGVEQADVFHGCEAVHLAGGESVWFTPEQCAFGYRDSVFKGPLKGVYLITAVHYRLARHASPNLSYAALREAFARKGIVHPTARQVAMEVIHIRRSKLPDPAREGNAGSFFKNPIVEPDTWQRLQSRHAGIRGFTLPDGKVKVPAAWLIEQCGWKGYREGPIGCNPRQPLVLINYGGASGAAIAGFARRIAWSVFERFGIVLEPEVQFIGEKLKAATPPDWPSRQPA